MNSYPCYINKDLIVGHKKDVDLSNLPDNLDELGCFGPRLIGYINRCRSYDDYAFGITNNYGVDHDATPSAPVQLFIKKEDWKDEEAMEENRWIVFELFQQPKNKRQKAKHVRYLRPTIDDYTLAKNYVEEYSKIEGHIQGHGFSERINTNIKESINKVFFATVDGKSLILNDLYEKKSQNCNEWKNFITHLTEEERANFRFDESLMHPTAELRIAMATLLGNVDLLRHPSVIAYLNSNIVNDSTHIESLFEAIKSEENKQAYLEYIVDNNLTTDELKVNLFLSSFSTVVYKKIADKTLIVRQCESYGTEKTAQLLLFYLHNLPENETAKLPDLLSRDNFIDAIKLLDTTEAYQLLNKLGETFATEIVTSEYRGTELFSVR